MTNEELNTKLYQQMSEELDEYKDEPVINAFSRSPGTRLCIYRKTRYRACDGRTEFVGQTVQSTSAGEQSS